MIVRVWASRAAVIGALVGFVGVFAIVLGSFWLASPGVEPDAVTLGARFRLAGALALSGLYAGSMAGLVAGFAHGLVVAWATTRGWLNTDDRRRYRRAVRGIGAGVIVLTFGAAYAVADLLGVVSGADGWLLGGSALAAGLIAAVLTPTIVDRYAGCGES